MNPVVATLNGWIRKVPVLPLYAAALVPAPLNFFWALNGDLGPEPVQALEHAYGKLALQFLIASLCVTPLVRTIRLNAIRLRRMMGLTAFYYLCLHLAIYAWLDRELSAGLIAEDLTKRPFIIVGAVATLALIPAAATSNDWAVRRLSALTWRRLHRLVYIGAAAGAIHYLWLVKAWPLEPIVYVGIVTALLVWRVWPVGAVKARMREAS